VLAAGAKSAPPHASVERFVFVLEGNPSLQVHTKIDLKPGSYAFLPAGTKHTISATANCKLIVIEKKHVPLAGAAKLSVIVGHEDEVEAKAFLGDEDARLKTLLPIEPAFDMAVNIFTYQPGATLPFVEIHVMEHGLQMIQGAGVYRLGEDYMPVAAGDIIWMASYCPQWFVAMGKQPARYIYYKDIHRDGLEMK
jgi:(S)-ureidoglycine aminohydrolase